MQKIDLILNTAYRQFFVLDGVDNDDIISNLHAQTAIDRRNAIQVADRVIAVYTARHGDTHISVELDNIEPTVNADKWDHIVEGSICVPSYSIQINTLNCAVAHAFIEVDFCVLRLRVHQGGLANVTDSDEEQGDDCYLLSFWPAPPSELVVIKQYTGVI